MRVVRGNGSGSGGDWTLYESRDLFEGDVLRSLIEEAGNIHARGRSFSRGSRAWLVQVVRRGKDVETAEWTVQRFIAAEQLVDGQWQDLGARLVEPSIAWGPAGVGEQQGERHG